MTKYSSIGNALGINRITDEIAALLTIGSEFVANAPTGQKPCCAWDAGSLSRRLTAKDVAPHLTLLIDMGGTHTKVAAKIPDGTWTPLFDHLNDWFKPKRDPALPLLQSFFRTLAGEIRTAINSLRLGNLPIRLAVIWSNQVKTKRFSNGATSGVTGLVHGFQSGGYRKGEWFLQEIHNGDDIGALLLSEFAHSDITPDVMLLGNDTLFTLFAVPGAHSGVVMSSGGNCTLVGTSPSDLNELYNSELGGMFMLPERFLSEGDRNFIKLKNLSGISLEELSAGNWFPHIVAAHVSTAKDLQEGGDLAALDKAIKDESIKLNNRALCDLLAGQSAAFEQLPQATIAALRALVTDLVTRSGALAGLLCYLSVVNQLQAGERHAIVSLDSSMARYFPGYFESVKRCVQKITPSESTVEVRLVEPIQLPQGGDISVPLQGAALALAAQ